MDMSLYRVNYHDGGHSWGTFATLPAQPVAGARLLLNGVRLTVTEVVQNFHSSVRAVVYATPENQS
jgi:hypothetical protein